MKNRFWKTFFIVVSIVILFALIGLTNGKNRNVTIAENLISDIFTFPQRLFIHVKNYIIKDEDFFSDIDKLKEENEKLKAENTELKNKTVDYELLVSENTLLKERSKMEAAYPDYNVVVAEVISDSANNWEEVFVINKGENDGIKPNMAVITTEGLVGYTETVSKNTSKVISIIDAGNSVSGRVTRTRDAIVCTGSSLLKETGKNKATYIPIGVELLEGDKIETSGMGGIYPKGIAIGEVKSFTIKKNPSENEATIETFVDFNRLETVAVIIGEN